MSARRRRSRSRFWLGAAGVVLAAAVSLGGCPALPTQPQEPCPGNLFCNSPSIPADYQCILPLAVDCAGNSYQGISVAYLCAFGSNRVPAGPLTTLGCARTVCPNAPTIVRCTR